MWCHDSSSDDVHVQSEYFTDPFAKEWTPFIGANLMQKIIIA